MQFNQDILNSLATHIAVIDRDGKIIAVNDAWRAFSVENAGLDSKLVETDANYFLICDLAAGPLSEGAAEVATGLRAVSDGTLPYFETEYPCHSPTEERWFLLRATPFKGQAGAVVVAHTNVTRLKKAEMAQQASEARFRQLAENSPDIIYILDLKLAKTVYFNRKDFLGYTVNELEQPGSISAAIHPDDAARVANHWQQVINGEADFIEYRLQAKDGHWEWLQSRETILARNDNGAAAQILVTLTIITARKQAEESLRESRNLFRQVITSISDHIYVTAVDATQKMTNLYLSPNLDSLTGYSLESLLADWNFWASTMIHPDDRTVAAMQIQKLIAGQSSEVEYRLVRPDNSIIWVRDSGRVVTEAGGRRVIYGVISDITTRVQADEQLRLLVAAIQSTSEGIMITDSQLDLPGPKIVFVNQGMCQMSGYSQDELLGQTPRILQGTEGQRGVRNALKTTLARGETHQGETTNYRKDGTPYQVTWHISPIFNGSQQITHYVALMQDVTDMQTLESQLRQSQKMDAIGQLAGSIAHDFNNLLIPMIGYAELGQMSLAPDDPVQANFSRIREAADRAANLTRQILAFSRQQLLEMRLLDLNEVVADFQKLLSRLLREDIALQVYLHPQLPLIKADQGQLEQVLLNLVINARDAMPAGGRLVIETDLSLLNETYTAQHPGVEPGLYALLSVSDTGHGMDTATQQRIFEPFFTTKARGQGTGLGLATVFGIIKQHRGNIWVFSEPGQGATFKIYLPLAEDPTARTLATQDIAAGQLTGGETILVVEDEAGVRRLVAHTLETHGYTVLQAATPQQALEHAAAHPATIHLLLTDVVLPGLNGRQLYSKLAVQRTSLKVLFMSGYADNETPHHNVLNLDAAFLAKPFSMVKLLRKVREVLKQAPGRISVIKTICAWCNKELSVISLQNEDASSEITHGLCPDCQAALLADERATLDEFLNKLDAPVLMVDGDRVVRLANQLALKLLGKELSQIRQLKTGNVFDCVYANLPDGCGQTIHCIGCAIRQSVTHTHQTGQSLAQVPATLNLAVGDHVEPVRFLISTERAGNLVLLQIDEVTPRD